MSYTVTTTIVKPAGIQWYSDANPSGLASIQQWELTQLGNTLLYKAGVSPDANTYVTTEVYASEAAYQQYLSLLGALPDAQARSQYNQNNNITFSSVTSGS